MYHSGTPQSPGQTMLRRPRALVFVNTVIRQIHVDRCGYFLPCTKKHYVKRFIIETSTLSKRCGFISEEWGSKLNLISMEEMPILLFCYRTKRGEKKYRQEYLANFVDVKGWKAMGNKLGNYLRMSSFKWVENEISSETEDEKEGKTIYSCFIDPKKAFVSISRAKLLEKFGTSRKILPVSDK